MFFSFGFQNKNFKICHAESEEENIEQKLEDNITNVLNDIDSSGLDEFVDGYSIDFFENNSFADIVSKILSGDYYTDYDSVADYCVSLLQINFKKLLSFALMILSIILLKVLFKNFCVDKYGDLKKVVSLVFSLVIVLIIAATMKDVAAEITNLVQKIFKFISVLFPIILNLIILSGASGSFSIYSSLSVFLLNTGSYIFIYILLPLSISIFMLSLVGSIFYNNRLTKTIDLFKAIFKYVVVFLFSVVGILSASNLVVSGVKDGVGLKITKFAIKNYIPILGGYISEGFDFVHAGSILVKNAFGVCGILVLVFMILKPLIVYFVYIITFKILSVVVSYVGENSCGDMFENVSKCMGYFVAVLVGVFMIAFVFIYLTIISVSVV